MAKVTGLCYLSINGQKLRSDKGATMKPGGAIRESVTDVNGFVGHSTTEIQPGEVKAKIIHTGEIDVVAVQNWGGLTLTFETDSGQRYLVREAAVVDAVELSGKELDVTFQVHPAERV